MLLAVTAGCSGTSSTGSTPEKKQLGPQVIDYVVSMNPPSSYYSLDVQYTEATGETEKTNWPSTVWTKHLRTKKGVPYVSLGGFMASTGQEPPAGTGFSMPTVQCTILVNGVEADTASSTMSANCEVNLEDWRPPTAPVGSKVSESPAALGGRVS